MENKFYTGLELFQLAYEGKIKDGQQFYIFNESNQRMIETYNRKPVVITYKNNDIITSDNTSFSFIEYTRYQFKPIRILDLDNPEEIMKELNKLGKTEVIIDSDGFNVNIHNCGAKYPKELCSKAGYETIKEALKSTILNLQKAESIKNYDTGKHYKWCNDCFMEIVKIPLQ